MSAALSVRRPLDSSSEIQWAVSAKYAARFELDQLSAVKLIRPQAFYYSKSVSSDKKRYSNYRKIVFETFERLLPMTHHTLPHLITLRDVGVDKSLTEDHQQLSELGAFDNTDRLI